MSTELIQTESTPQSPSPEISNVESDSKVTCRLTLIWESHQQLISHHLEQEATQNQKLAGLLQLLHDMLQNCEGSQPIQAALEVASRSKPSIIVPQQNIVVSR